MDNTAVSRHRNFLTLVDYAGDSQGFAAWARLSSKSVAAWERDVNSVTNERAAMIESRLSLPAGWLSLDSSMPSPFSLSAIRAPLVEAENPVNIRRANLQLLVAKVGTKLALTPLTGIAASNLSKVAKKEFTDYIARKIESNLGVAEGWMDTPHEVDSWEDSLPAEVLEKLNRLANERQSSGASSRKNSHKPAEHSSMSRPDQAGVSFGKNWPPLSRALVEKTAALIDSGKLTEEIAFGLFGQLMQIERGMLPELSTSLPLGSSTPATSQPAPAVLSELADAPSREAVTA